MDAHAQPYLQVTRCHWLAPRPEDTSSGTDLTFLLRCADFVPVQAPGRDVVDWWTLSTYRRAKVVFTRLRCAVWCCAQSDVHCLCFCRLLTVGVVRACFRDVVSRVHVLLHAACVVVYACEHLCASLALVKQLLSCGVFAGVHGDRGR